MGDAGALGRVLIVVGLLIAASGLFLLLVGRVPFLGRLPGDIAIQRGNWSVYFPIVTCIVLSIALTIVLNLFARR